MPREHRCPAHGLWVRRGEKKAVNVYIAGDGAKPRSGMGWVTAVVMQAGDLKCFSPTLGPFLTAGGKDVFQDRNSVICSWQQARQPGRLTFMFACPKSVLNCQHKCQKRPSIRLSNIFPFLIFFFLGTLKNRSQLPAFLQLEREDEGLVSSARWKV